MLSETSARRLAGLMTERQKQDITLLALVLRTDHGGRTDSGRRRAEQNEQRSII